MVLESTRLLWAIQRILASSSWWLRTAARARVLLKPSSFIYVLHSLSWEDQMAGARTSAAHCSSLSLSFSLSSPSQWCLHMVSAGQPPGCQISYRADEDTKRERSKRARWSLYAPFHTWPRKSECSFCCTLLVAAMTKPIQCQGVGT